MRTILLILLVPNLCLALTSGATRSFDADRKSPALRFLPDEKAEVLESVVEVNGLRYHSIEYQGTVYFLRLFTTRKSEPAIEDYCKQSPVAFDRDERAAPLLTVESQVTPVSLLFVESLKRHCSPLASIEDLALGKIEEHSRKGLSGGLEIHYNPLEDLLGLKSDF